MRMMRSFLIAAITMIALLASAATASAGPVEDFCERSPRDGKAVWYRIICE